MSDKDIIVTHAGECDVVRKCRKDNNSAVAGAIAGGIVGAAIGSICGPGGAVIGGRVGASLGAGDDNQKKD